MPTNQILVVPLEVLTTAAVVTDCGSAALGSRGALASLEPTGGCGGAAAAAFGRMSASWLAELARLSEQSVALAGLLRASAGDYVATDRGAVLAAPGNGRS